VKSAAKVQQKMHICKKSEKIFTKKDRFIYPIRHFALTHASMKVKCYMSNDKALAAFVNIFEQPVIWAAFHERSFEVGERSEVGALEVTTK
jgi:hypothetical protein